MINNNPITKGPARRMKDSIAYLVFADLNSLSGVTRKIKSQAEGFFRNACTVELMCQTLKNIGDDHGEMIFSSFEKDESCLIQRAEISFKKRIRFITLFRTFFSFFMGARCWHKVLSKKKIHIVYARYSPFLMIEFLLMKMMNPKYQFFVEIPTYPYDGETVGLLKLFNEFWVEKYILRTLYRFYITKWITFSKDLKIYGVSTIQVTNGMPIPDVPPDFDFQKESEPLCFTMVAMLAKWHGADRFLKGMDKAGLSNVHFDIVGQGEQEVMDELYKIVSQSQYLQEHVTFHGFLSGAALENIYKRTHVAVGSLACHRIGLSDLAPLKMREYAYYGLPFVIGYHDASFQSSHFVYHIPADESPVDIPQVVDWYKSSLWDSRQIHAYALTHFSWQTILAPVVDQMVRCRRSPA